MGKLLWIAPLGVVATAHLLLHDPFLRLQFLRVALLLMAVGEGTAAVLQVFFAPSFGARNGRPYDPAYHGVTQDFGFYNFAMALLFALAAFDPTSSAGVIRVGIALYAIHGGTHLLRYFGLYYGGETPVATRPRRLELRDGLTLMPALAAMLLFFP